MKKLLFILLIGSLTASVSTAQSSAQASMNVTAHVIKAPVASLHTMNSTSADKQSAAGERLGTLSLSGISNNTALVTVDEDIYVVNEEGVQVKLDVSILKSGNNLDQMSYEFSFSRNTGVFSGMAGGVFAGVHKTNVEYL